MLSINEIKQKVGEQASQLVKDNMIVGIGTGTTVYYFITALAKRIKTGLKCTGVPTSKQTLLLAEQHGISMVELNDVQSIDLTIDGADEIDMQLQLLKGGGGALLQEKMVATASKEMVVIIDNNKLKTQLGSFPLPIEVVPYGWKQVQKHINDLYSIKAELRTKDEEPFCTDHGHYILDCHFHQIMNPETLNNSLHLIPGVVETGLFINLCSMALIGQPDGNVLRIERSERQSL